MSIGRFMLMLSVASLIGGCAASSRIDNVDQVVIDRLYFGRNLQPAGVVSDSAWVVFVQEAVTPKFPRGFTIWRTEGQWGRSDGTIEREPTFVLEIIRKLTDDKSAPMIDEIRAEYKRMFRQESVLHLVTTGTATF